MSSKYNSQDMIDQIDKLVYNIIYMPNFTEHKKKGLLTKLVHSPLLKGGQSLDQNDVTSVFETCISIITATEGDKAADLAVFAFGNWASEYKSFLKAYLTPEKIIDILSGQINVVVLIMWLKETLSHLLEDADALATLAPILEEILVNKLRDLGSNSLFLSRLAELYAMCPLLLPPPHTRLAFTKNLMNCVASFPTPTKADTRVHMISIGGLVNTLWNGLRLEDILASLNAMYAIISSTDENFEVCPAMTHLLSLVPTTVVEALAPRIVQDNATTDAALMATLNRLTLWLVTWPMAQSTLGLWVRTLVRLLYQNGRVAVPSKITNDNVSKLLNAMKVPVVRAGIVSVISTLLLSMQHSPIGFHKVIKQFIDVLGWLENENSDNAKGTANRLASLLYVLMALHPGYPQLYQPLMDVIVEYEPPTDEDIQELIREHNWFGEGGSANVKSQIGSGGMIIEAPPTYQYRALNQRAGLRNLGNTCYMNSVIQALFMTDSFRHQTLHAVPRNNQHLLVKLQHVFSLLCFTSRMYVAPRSFHDNSRPSWFETGRQQDCSEYLRYLMITLHEEERNGQKLPEYQERVIIESETASLASDLQPLPYDSATEDFTDMEQPLKADNFIDDAVTCMKIEENTVNDNACGQGVSLVKMDVEVDTSTIFLEKFRDHDGEEAMEIDEERELEVNSNKISDSSEKYVEDHNSKYNCKTPVPSSSKPNASKHRLSANYDECVTKPTGKSSKIETATDIDNSSDSGISGDLAEDLELRSPNTSSPTPKESFLPNRDIMVEEVMVQESDIKESDNEYFVSLVHKIFGGKLATCIKCLQCKTESIHKDTFTDIHLAFQDRERYNAANAIRRNPERFCKQKSKDNPVDLRIEDMITNYLTSEMLTGENQYQCERCGGKQDAERSIQILEPPEHLILTQLRFYYDTAKEQRQKVFTNVEFGEELSLPVRYSTQGVIDDSFNLSKESAVQGFLSGEEIKSEDNIRSSENKANDCASNTSGSNAFSVPPNSFICDETCGCASKICQCQKTSSDFQKGNVSQMYSTNQNSYTNEIQSVCKESDEINEQVDCSNIYNEHPTHLSDNYNSSSTLISDASSTSNFNDIIQGSSTYVAQEISVNSEPQPSCSDTISDNVLRSSQIDSICDDDETSGCMTPKDKSEMEQESESISYARYALYGVVVHSGFSSEGGHYYCYARNSSIASLPDSAKERYGALGGWYNFNDEKVTNTSFTAINNLTRTFSRDTAYQLFYKRLSDCLNPEVPLTEDFKGLRLDLREAIETDNLLYRSEQERDLRRRCYATGGSHFSPDSDHDGTPPPGGCGGGPGGGGFNTASRVVF